MSELEKATGQPARNIRYLISEGIVPAPIGNTRLATYDERHVRALSIYAESKSKGYRTAQIRGLVEAALGNAGLIALEPFEGVKVEVSTEVLAKLGAAGIADVVRSALEKAQGEVSEEQGNED